MQDLLLYIVPRWFKIGTLYAHLKEEIQILKLTSVLVPLKTEKCHPLTSRTGSGMDSLIRNMLYRGLSVPKMNDQFLKTQITDVFISMSLCKSAVRKIIKPETPYRVMDGGSPRPQLTHYEPN